MTSLDSFGSVQKEERSQCRHVAIITPSFFGYEKDIAEGFRRHEGSTVTIIDERPSNSTVARAVYRAFPRLAAPSVRRHFDEWHRRLVEAQPDVVLVIKAEVMPEQFLKALRSDLPEATFVFYAFDTLSSSGRWVRDSALFDLKFSFDHRDVEQTPGLRYLPLFAGREYYPGDDEPRYDLAFVGTVHSGRYAFVTRLAQVARRPYIHFYVPARWLVLARRWSRDFRGVPLSAVRVDKLSRGEVAEVFRNARVVVDLQRAGQSGLTMRTFEALASGAVLLTTNPRATELAPRVGPGRIAVVDQGDPEAAAAALERLLTAEAPSRDVETAIRPYRLDAWVATLLAAVEEHRATRR